MKFIHTSDWHLGKILHGVHLTPDQRIVLDDLKEILAKERPDALIIAGDIYDRAIPPVEAVELFSEFTQSVLMDLGIPIIAMAGNHDSAERIQFGSKLLSENKLHIIGKSKKGYEKVVLEDAYGEVAFYVIPYTDPAYIRAWYGVDTIRTHDDAFEAITGRILEEKGGERSVVLVHAYVQGGQIHSDSERPLSIGGTDMVKSSHFKPFNYAALGHLHAPQRAGEDFIRYSGSLMKYSISEASQKKSVYMVEIGGDGTATHKSISIKAPKDVRQVKGLLEDILAAGREDAYDQDYVMAIIEDEGALLDPMEKIRSVYPNAIGMKRTFLEKQQEVGKGDINYSNFNKMSIGSLFDDFFTHVTGEEFTDEHKSVFETITREVERE